MTGIFYMNIFVSVFSKKFERNNISPGISQIVLDKTKSHMKSLLKRILNLTRSKVFENCGNSIFNCSIKRNYRFILFSAGVGLIIWITTFYTLITYTGIDVIYNKLLSVLAVLTYWFIMWIIRIRQYVNEREKSLPVLIKIRLILKFIFLEIVHFCVLFLALLTILFFIEKYL